MLGAIFFYIPRRLDLPSIIDASATTVQYPMPTTIHFKRSEVEALLLHSNQSETARNIYGDQSEPGDLMLVGDEGIYLMSVGIPGIAHPTKGYPYQMVAYARESNPDAMGHENAYEAKRALYGGDDGAERLPASLCTAMLQAGTSKWVAITLLPNRISAAKPSRSARQVA